MSPVVAHLSMFAHRRFGGRPVRALGLTYPQFSLLGQFLGTLACALVAAVVMRWAAGAPTCGVGALSDYLSIGVIARVFPVDAVREAPTDCGRSGRR